MRILLFASDTIGLEIAQFLYDKKDTPVVLVLDNADRGGCNDEIIRSSGVAENSIVYSDKLGVNETVKWLQDLQLDIGVMVWWPNIINKTIIDIPKRGIVNFHPSFLPYNRGRDPSFWSLLNSTPFGVTIHKVDEGIDTGDIIVQEKLNVVWEDTAKSLYEEARISLVSLFKRYYDDIKEDRIALTPQDLNTGSCHYRKDLNNASHINLDKKYKASDLLNLLRAKTFYPYPAAWFEDDGKKYEVQIKIKQVNNEKQNKKLLEL